MSTRNGIGTKFLGFSFRQPDGSHFATEWFVFWDMPVVPLRRRHLIVGHTRVTGDPSSIATGYYTEETPYIILGGTRMRLLEVLATYLAWWVAGPALAASPFLITGPLVESFKGHMPFLVFFVIIIATLFACFLVPYSVCRLTQRLREIPYRVS